MSYIALARHSGPAVALVAFTQIAAVQVETRGMLITQRLLRKLAFVDVKAIRLIQRQHIALPAPAINRFELSSV